MEKTPVGAGSDLIDDVGLQVDVEGAGDVLARGGLREESAEAVIVGGRRALYKAPIRLMAGSGHAARG